MSVRTALRLLPTRSICNENGWEFGPPAQRQSCEWLEAGNLHFHLTCLIQRFQHVPTFTKLCFPSVEPIEIGSSRFCEKKFAESFARRCPWPPPAPLPAVQRLRTEQLSSCVQNVFVLRGLCSCQRSPLYSGAQDICTRIHPDTRL